jgi:vacuolar-type H+-ATPase subunit E/Vma4|tara:strand:+ start:1453 stop:2097 length:645 start_codon:yes stop_codon:yes gene_type:complete
MSESSMELEAQLIERIVEQRKQFLKDADNEVEKIVGSAMAEVARINANSEAEILSLIGSDLNAAKDRIIGNAQLEGRKNLLLARQAILTGVYDEVMERLTGIARRDDTDFDKGGILIALIKEAAEEVGGEEFIVSGNEADLDYLGKNLGNVSMALKQSIGESKVSLDSEPLDIGGGVVVRNSDGTKTYYNTFEGRLASVRARIESEIAESLGVL